MSKSGVRRCNNEYARTQKQSKAAYVKAQKITRPEDIKAGLKEAKRLRKLFQRMPAGNPMCSNILRVVYVRFADDVLITVLGPRALAIYSLITLSNALEDLGLDMKDSKTHVVKSTTGVQFLGAHIRKFRGVHLGKRTISKKLGGKVLKSRVYPELGLNVSIKHILEKYEIKGIVR